MTRRDGREVKRIIGHSKAASPETAVGCLPDSAVGQIICIKGTADCLFGCFAFRAPPDRYPRGCNPPAPLLGHGVYLGILGYIERRINSLVESVVWSNQYPLPLKENKENKEMYFLLQVYQVIYVYASWSVMGSIGVGHGVGMD